MRRSAAPLGAYLTLKGIIGSTSCSETFFHRIAAFKESQVCLETLWVKFFILSSFKVLNVRQHLYQIYYILKLTT